MGIIISDKEKVDGYFNHHGVGQSSLKGFLKGLDKFLENRSETKDVYYEEKDYLIYGSGVDLKLTGKEEQFEQEFHVSTISTKPSDTIMKICHRVVEICKEEHELDKETHPDYTLEAFWADRGDSLEYFEETTLRVCEELEYGSKWKPETKLSKVYEANEYFKDIIASDGKTVIGQEELDKINSIEMSLRSNPRTAKYFDREFQSKQGNMDFYYQLPIYFEHRGVDCKALLDFVAVTKDPKGNVIKIEPFDLKTMSGPTLNFFWSVKTRRYDIQAAWYTLALSKMFSVPEESIEPFKFIVESTTQPGTPLVYQLEKSFMLSGKTGLDQVGIGDHVLRDRVKGYEDLLDEYIWYEENGWETDKRIAESNGVLELGWNGISE